MCAVSTGVGLLQYRIEKGKPRFRVRLGSHLIYYFVGVWASTTSDIDRTVFRRRGQPIHLASQTTDAVHRRPHRQPELAGAPIDADVAAAAAQGNAAIEPAPFTADQRHSLKWVYAVF